MVLHVAGADAVQVAAIEERRRAHGGEFLQRSFGAPVAPIGFRQVEQLALDTKAGKQRRDLRAHRARADYGRTADGPTAF